MNLTLSNLFEEDAIALLLHIEHNISHVYADSVRIEIDVSSVDTIHDPAFSTPTQDRVLDCRLDNGPCGVGKLYAGKSKVHITFRTSWPLLRDLSNLVRFTTGHGCAVCSGA